MTKHHGRRAARPLATGMMGPPTTTTRRIIIPMKIEPSIPFAGFASTIEVSEKSPFEKGRPNVKIETTLDELKTHLRGAQIVLRSKTPELVEQEFFGLLMAHFAIRGLMHEAALKADEDPDRLSFVHSVRVVQRRMARYGAIPPSAQKSPSRKDT